MARCFKYNVTRDCNLVGLSVSRILVSLSVSRLVDCRLVGWLIGRSVGWLVGCTYGEVGLEGGDLLSEGNILLLELCLEGCLSISLIVQRLELFLSDFGLEEEEEGEEEMMKVNDELRSGEFM